MTGMLEFVQAHGMEDENRGRIWREGKKKVLCRQNNHTVPMAVSHKIFKQGFKFK
jgi:hypothetical protein